LEIFEGMDIAPRALAFCKQVLGYVGKAEKMKDFVEACSYLFSKTRNEIK
jgi:hypothetical protein